jgi:hypothetical protein
MKKFAKNMAIDRANRLVGYRRESQLDVILKEIALKKPAQIRAMPINENFSKEAFLTNISKAFSLT